MPDYKGFYLFLYLNENTSSREIVKILKLVPSEIIGQ